MKKMKRTLCLLLVLAMSLSLMNLPAFAVTDPSSESACTMEEHKHTEACYAPGEPVLTCEEEHEHTEACYTPGEPVLSCTLEEHEHSEDCAAAPVVEDEPEETDTTELPALFGLREAKKGGGGDVEGNLQTDPSGKIENNENLSQYEGGRPITVGDKAIVFKQSTDAIVVVPAGCTSTWDEIKEALFAQTNDGNLDNIKEVSVYQVDPSKDVTYVVHKTPITVRKDGVVIVNGDLSHITWGTAPGQHEEPETISVTVTKVWQDADGNDLTTGLPESVTVELWRDDAKVNGQDATLKAPDWAYTWDKLDKDGNYTVKEVGESSGAITLGGKEYGVTYGGSGNALTVTNKAKPTDPPPPPTSTPETGSLTIHKVVEALGNPIVKDVDFTFNVQGPGAVKGNTYTADGNQSVSFDETGKATVTIKGQGNVTVKGLPAGEYTISENAPNGPEGYTWKGVSFKNHSDQDKDAQITVCVGTDNGSKNVQVNAHNRYEKTPDPETETGSLTITKAVAGIETADLSKLGGKTFTFTVTGENFSKTVTVTAKVENGDVTYTSNPETLSGLPCGEYTITETEPTDAPDGYTWKSVSYKVGDETVTDGKVNVAKDTTVAVTATNTYKPTTPEPKPETVSLAVTKTVVDATADHSVPADATFTIKVKLGNEENVVGQTIYADTENAIKKATYLEDGVYVISLKAGETATIHKIPVGTKYTVLEDDPGAGWTKSGEVTAATVLTENAAVTVTNTYKPTTPDPKPETVSLAVTKTVVDATANHSVPADATFTIKVKLGNEEKVVAQTIHADDELRTTNYLEDGVYVISLKAGETATIHKIPVGTEYTVLEDDPGAGWTKSGEVTAATELTENAAVTVTNTYKPTTPEPEPETGALTVTKTVVDATADHSVPADATFTIKVKLGGEDTPATLAEGEEFNGNGTYTFRLKGGESAAINGIPAGTAYEVSEDNPGRGWVSAVNNGSGGIDGEASVSVTNTWNGTRDTGTTDPSTGSLKITKVIDGGGEAATEEVFTFTVAGPNGFNQSVEITGAGEVTLNDLEPGNYTVTESDAAISGYNWEKSGDGSVTVTADATAEVTVTNTYRTEVIVPDPETPTTRPDPRPTPRPTPTPDPEPETDIPDDPTPRVDVPDAPTPEVNIPDDPTPKTDIPDAPTPEVNIPDDPTPEVNIPDDPTPKTDIPDVQPPMISWPPVVEVPEEDIPDEDVPMASVPKTGDISLVWYAAALMSACGLSALTIKKRKDEEQD